MCLKAQSDEVYHLPPDNKEQLNNFLQLLKNPGPNINLQAHLDVYYFINKIQYNQRCDNSQIKREIERSFLVRLDVKLDTIACKGTPRQQNIHTIVTTNVRK